MSDPDEPRPQGFPAEGITLGGLGAADYDRSLTPDADDAALEPEGAEAGQPPSSAPGDEDQLALPRGGLVSFRKSGGLHFSSRGIVVYRTGWVVPLEGTAGRPRHMTPAALEALERLLLRSGMSRRHHMKAAGSRDGYYYELTARYGGRTRSVEVADGAIPADLRRLIDVLQKLLPKG